MRLVLIDQFFLGLDLVLFFLAASPSEENNRTALVPGKIRSRNLVYFLLFLIRSADQSPGAGCPVFRSAQPMSLPLNMYLFFFRIERGVLRCPPLGSMFVKSWSCSSFFFFYMWSCSNFWLKKYRVGFMKQKKLELLQFLVQIHEVESVKYKNAEHASSCLERTTWSRKSLARSPSRQWQSIS
jgi:hypothetical protein